MNCLYVFLHWESLGISHLDPSTSVTVDGFHPRAPLLVFFHHVLHPEPTLACAAPIVPSTWSSSSGCWRWGME